MKFIEHQMNFLKKYRDKLNQFEITHPITSGFITYLGLTLIVFVVFSYTSISFFIPQSIEINNARYLISTIIQYQAAIIALVISLTIIAVQTTASSYGSRVIPIFKRSPDLWILIALYFFSLLIGLFLLLHLDGVINYFSFDQNYLFLSQIITIKLRDIVILDFIIGLCSFLALIPYLLNTIDLLKIERLIKIFSTGITKKDFLHPEIENNAFEALSNLIHISIKQNDISMTKFGLNELIKKFKEIWPTECNGLEGKSIVQNVRGELIRCCDFAAEKKDDRIFGENIKIFQEFYDIIPSEEQYKDLKHNALNGYRIIGKIAIKNDLEDSIRIIIENLSELIKFYITNNQKDESSFVRETFKEFFWLSIKNDQIEAIENIVSKLDSINQYIAPNAVFKKDLSRNLILLNQIGIYAIENDFETIPEKVITSIELIGKIIIVQNDLEFLNDDILFHLTILGNTAADKENKRCFSLVKKALGNLGKEVKFDKGKLKESKEHSEDDKIFSGEAIDDESCGSLISSALNKISIHCVNNQWDSQTLDIIDLNCDLWHTAIKTNDNYTKRQTIETIKNIGISAAQKKLKHSTSYSRTALFNIFKASKEDENSFADAIEAFGEIASASAEYNLTSAESESFEEIEKIIDQNATWILVKPLVNMGIIFEERNLSKNRIQVGRLLKILIEKEPERIRVEILEYKKWMNDNKENALDIFLKKSGISLKDI
jgi:hypothetical protein